MPNKIVLCGSAKLLNADWALPFRSLRASRAAVRALPKLERVPREIRSAVTCALQQLAPTVAMVPGTRMVQQRVPAMMAYVVSEGRFFALKPSEWGMLLIGVALCGFAALFF